MDNTFTLTATSAQTGQTDTFSTRDMNSLRSLLETALSHMEAGGLTQLTLTADTQEGE
jgi:hypothetical protein